jgi:tight adherence protein C
MLLLIFGLILGAIALIVWGAFGAELTRGPRLKLPEDAATRKTRRVQLRSLLDRIFPFSRAIMQKLKLEGALKLRIDAAHVTLTPQEFFNIKLLVILLAMGIIFFVLRNTDPVTILIGLAIGYIIPDIYLNQKIKQRKEAIARLIPETVDLLGLCVEAGLDFTTSVKWIIEKIPRNPLLEELAFVLEEIKWGKSRVQALRDMSKRLGIPEVSSFVQTLVQAERMGTPVAEAFSILSEDTRMQRFHRGERTAMKAPLKILIPLIFCILPVIGIVIGGPIMLQFMQGGMLKGLGG